MWFYRHHKLQVKPTEYLVVARILRNIIFAIVLSDVSVSILVRVALVPIVRDGVTTTPEAVGVVIWEHVV